jgi:ankyrin repeat protein
MMAALLLPLLLQSLAAHVVETAGGAAILRAVAMRGDLGHARELLESGRVTDVDGADSSGATALYWRRWACWKGERHVVAALLEAGAEADGADNDGFTPLMVAGYYGHSAVVQLLVDAGAHLHLKDATGSTAQDWAALQGEDECAALASGREAPR